MIRKYEYLLEWMIDSKDKVLVIMGYNKDYVSLEFMDTDSCKEIVHSRIRNRFDMHDKNQRNDAVMTLLVTVAHKFPEMKNKFPDFYEKLRGYEERIKKSTYRGIFLENLLESAIDVGLGGRR